MKRRSRIKFSRAAVHTLAGAWIASVAGSVGATGRSPAAMSSARDAPAVYPA